MDQASTPLQQSLSLRVEGMDCADCAAKLEKGINGLEGVAECQVSFATGKLTLVGDPALLDLDQIQRRVRGLGYTLVLPDQTDQEPVHGLSGLVDRLRRKPRETLTAFCGLSILLAAGASLAGLPALVSTVLYALAMLAGGYHIARRALGSIRTNRELDINVLMTIAVIGAAIIGEWSEGAVVVFLFSLGEMLEGYTMDRARGAIRSLIALAPPAAIVLRPCVDCEGHRGHPLPNGDLYHDGPCPWCEPHEIQTPVDELAMGDVLLVRPGERIPMDGTVRSGRSAVNQAPITGESVPVDRGPGDAVFAGTINGTSTLEIKVTCLAVDNTVSRMIRLVEEAQAQKAPTQRWIDRFARVYTPVVVALAALAAVLPPLLFGEPFLNTATTTGWLYRALTLLVIACPCALVISTPVTIVSAIGSGARSGVLIKGGATLEALGRLRAIAFDKTGTLTQGNPELTEVLCVTHPERAVVDCTSCDDVLALAVAVERRTSHPLAAAVVRAAEARQLNGRYVPADQVEAVLGLGVRGVVAGQNVAVSSHRYVHELNLHHSEAFCSRVSSTETSGRTTLLLHDDSGLRGFLAVSDPLRAGAGDAIAALRTAGIEHIVMLTGDNQATAAAIASQAGIDRIQANLLPEDKLAAVESLLAQYGEIAMVGDGINDAPALARATVGIAMGGAGSDQALETAGVVLMGDDLALLPFAVRLSRQARTILNQNLFLSLGIKVIFLLLALGGMATLWGAVFADVGASLIVILNGMRLLRSRPAKMGDTSR
jgi:Cd2+/Zn2+-exporting ATPase